MYRQYFSGVNAGGPPRPASFIPASVNWPVQRDNLPQNDGANDVEEEITIVSRFTKTSSLDMHGIELIY